MPKAKKKEDQVRERPPSAFISDNNDGDIEFWGKNTKVPILAIKPNGEFYVKGKLKATEPEAYKGINMLMNMVTK